MQPTPLGLKLKVVAVLVMSALMVATIAYAWWDLGLDSTTPDCACQCVR